MFCFVSQLWHFKTANFTIFIFFSTVKGLVKLLHIIDLINLFSKLKRNHMMPCQTWLSVVRLSSHTWIIWGYWSITHWRGTIPLRRGAIALRRGAISLRRGAIPLRRGAIPLRRDVTSKTYTKYKHYI
jgi:hypothetical protein